MVIWAKGLNRLVLGVDKAVESVSWPIWLQELAFRFGFNHPIVGVESPASLQRLSFGGHFNQPVPDFTLGVCFDRSLAAVVWPASFRRVWECECAEKGERVSKLRVSSCRSLLLYVRHKEKWSGNRFQLRHDCDDHVTTMQDRCCLARTPLVVNCGELTEPCFSLLLHYLT